MSAEKFNLFSFSGKMKTLHLSWMAFFITFVVWFNAAPLLSVIADTLGLTTSQIKTLLILNVALTIPARIIIGMVTDKYGPRLTYSVLMGVCSIPCFMFAVADTFEQLALARFLIGFIGAGFVIGIRIVSEWFPAKELGTAEGIYGGWGNFGSAAAAFTLPAIAIFFGGEDGWRYAIGLTGLMSLVFAFVYYFNVTDTPKGSTYFKPKKAGGLEVTSKGDFALLIFMKIPMYATLALLAWKLSPAGVSMLDEQTTNIIYAALVGVFFVDLYQTYQVNKDIFVKEVPEFERYPFKQVAVLNVLYFTTFGSELAVVSMLPLFFAETFGLGMAQAGMVASSYAFMNLMSRPGGGWLSDKFGRKNTLLILTAGLAVGYFAVGQIDGTWSLPVAIVVVMACSFFVQGGEGAVFAAVPLIKRRLTGQIAGMTGAYGNVGAVFFLTVYSMVPTSTFFYVIAVSAVLGFITLFFMAEPKGHMTEVNEKGEVTLISVN
ncbi:NarK family nitrate/nitrite MFS transporter [Shewanella sp. 1_MG-2023]|uniref:Nitrate/nitrite transporter n=1 Tax=Shewanella electrodiphila TaxID=934143 RepID=A0ABT0KN52_9GAMM|nr:MULTISPECIES: NarK family nitrate/nitrite MFS transporter [Shewanella]MCC4831432.1 NarK family nitrate/nitrite MFS transporter [Shewanella sp. 10N.7]MCL1045270.1 NarK family nitrate/nitrite MFS transporter [Shewanella electrodiphila]MDO6611912.1 NarK family nitrate/nitrite MFS transporter [Shewanella sp. 7_MG-2023]MDO6771767.1 NarK family nitrate/nitrite MFS transporter [Shewanella sp. 2_MG-2023]MDO6793993.1 NarK family nitrate/nitrite MFS transporter [Shewanella sp. 1_MG-2023]